VTVKFGTTLGDLGNVTFNGNGVYTAPLTSKVAGTAKVTASVNSAALDQTVNVVFKDVTPPKPPVVDPTNGEVVTGCAEPGSTITVRDAAGKVIGTGVAGDDCRFSIELKPAQEPGAKISVTATDKDGNVSESAKVQVGLIRMELASKSLPRGSTQVATGRLFQPGEQVSAVLRSDPIALGSAIADENGDVVFTFQVPESLELGKHSVILTGGFSGTISEEFTVVDSPKLSDTGSDLSIPLMVGGILALLGGLIIVGLRRRGTKSSEEPSAS
jgi:adhesin/invasin